MRKTPKNKAITDFFNSGTAVRFTKGELILQAGKEPQGVYMLASGHVKSYSISSAGEEYIHIIFGPGEVFPLIWALKNVHRDVFYEALDDVRLLRICRSALAEAVNNNTAIASGMLDVVAEQFATVCFRVDNLEYKAINKRLMYRLLFLASRFGVRRGETIVIDAPITHKILGDTINLSRESVSRELKKLEHQGLIGRAKGRLTINNLAKLEDKLGDAANLHEWGLKD
jgi:CRP-like cAMP-binding protein